MARAVKGFMSNSGIFFDNYDDARRKDAEDTIRQLCAEKQVKADSLLNLIEAMADPIKEYIDAYQASQNVPAILKDRDAEDTREPDRYSSDDADGSDDNEAVE